MGEFPEVQGFMGRIFAGQIGLPASVAAACEEHYKPVGPNDRVPADKVSVTVALADKLDTLVGFWVIDEKPTGSKDPYALRRAALGVIRLVVENNLRFPLAGPILGSLAYHWSDQLMRRRDEVAQFFGEQLSQIDPDELIAVTDVEPLIRRLVGDYEHSEMGKLLFIESPKIERDLLSFFHDRLKVMLRDSGARHDLVDAVLGNGETNDDLLLVVRRVEALGKFLDTEDGKNLLAGYKRAANLLRDEEKKAKKTDETEGAFEAAADPALLTEASEKALNTSLIGADKATVAAIADQDFEMAMRAMAKLRAPVDAFFDAVMVNAEDPAIRRNRLALLATLRRVTRQVADFSKIAG